MLRNNKNSFQRKDSIRKIFKNIGISIIFIRVFKLRRAPRNITSNIKSYLFFKHNLIVVNDLITVGKKLLY